MRASGLRDGSKKDAAEWWARRSDGNGLKIGGLVVVDPSPVGTVAALVGTDSAKQI